MQYKKIALYIRLSVEDGDLRGNSKKEESYSISNQKALLHQFVHLKDEFSDCEVLEFCDDGYTGTNFNRPAFQKMMELVKSKELSCIIVKDFSRFGREFLDVSSYLELIFPVFNTRFISVNDAFDSNAFVGTTGGMELAFRNLINGMYSRDISLKVKSARMTRFKQGEYLGGHPFYGYLRDPKDKHHLIVDENARAVISLIFQLCIEGFSAAAIAKRLNELDILCPLEYRKLRGIRYPKEIIEERAVWIPGTVLKIIKDERYTGKMVSNVCRTAGIGKSEICSNDRKDWIIVENTHEAIISESTFNAANESLSSRIKTINKNTSWKNSKNLFVCGHCGRKLQKSGKIETNLYCLKDRYTDDAECADLRMDKKDLENKVLKSIKALGEVLTNGTLLAKKKEQQESERLEKELATSEKRLKKLKNGKMDLYERYKDGELSREQFLELQNRNGAEIEKLEISILARREQLKVQTKKQSATGLIVKELRTAAFLTKYDPVAISRLIEKILVFKGGRIELVLKNRDAYEMLNLDVCKGA